MAYYADLGDLEEDTRIEAMGRIVMNSPKSSADKPVIAAFVVEDDAKADRYVKKLQAKFPGLRIIDRFEGPCKGMVSVRFAGPLV